MSSEVLTSFTDRFEGLLTTYGEAFERVMSPGLGLTQEEFQGRFDYLVENIIQPSSKQPYDILCFQEDDMTELVKEKLGDVVYGCVSTKKEGSMSAKIKKDLQVDEVWKEKVSSKGHNGMMLEKALTRFDRSFFILWA